MKEYQQRLRREYEVIKSKRHVWTDALRQKAENRKKSRSRVALRPSYTAQFSFNLPLVLTREYHERHRLCLDDLRHIFDVVEVRLLWLLALSHNIDVTTSAIHACAGTAESITYSGNTVIITKLLQRLLQSEDYRQIGLSSNTKRLICPYDEHRPHLPVHFVTQSQMEVMTPSTSAKHRLYVWKGTFWVAYRYYNGYLQLLGVVPRDVHRQRHGAPENLIAAPFEFLVDDVVYVSTTESMLIQTEENHRRLCDMAQNIVQETYGTVLFMPQ